MPELDVVRIDTPGLGDRSYVATDGTVAVVVDPQRDLDRVVAVLDDRRLRLTHVLETHVHNDYVSGGLALARDASAAYVVPAGDGVAFERVAVVDGDRLPAGGLVVEAIATPGHTPHHMSYAVGPAGAPAAVFTGGSLLFGTVGRTDLVSDAATEALARRQHRSVRRLATVLHDDVDVLPTHGFGSFCASGPPSERDGSTIGDERATNPAFAMEEDEFVRWLLAGYGDWPRYYAHMAPMNRQGAGPLDLSAPPAATAADLRRRLHAGEWVVDLRRRRAYAADHVRGTVGVELGDSFATYLGWLLPWGTPVTLLGDDAGDVADAQRALARIGVDRPAAAAVGGPDHWAPVDDRSAYRVGDLADLAAALDDRPVTVLDVRQANERTTGRLAGSVGIPIHELPYRLDEVPGGEVWVHCASGYRASVAASLLDRGGRRVVLVDDEIERAEAAGLVVERGDERR